MVFSGAHIISGLRMQLERRRLRGRGRPERELHGGCAGAPHGAPRRLRCAPRGQGHRLLRPPRERADAELLPGAQPAAQRRPAVGGVNPPPLPRHDAKLLPAHDVRVMPQAPNPTSHRWRCMAQPSCCSSCLITVPTPSNAGQRCPNTVGQLSCQSGARRRCGNSNCPLHGGRC